MNDNRPRSTNEIVHICQQQDWQNAIEAGIYSAESLSREGFIHCSRPVQVLGVVKAFYSNLPDLVLLWLDPVKLEADIRWERVGEQDFPHIYGPINIDAVIRVTELIPDKDGIYRTMPTAD